MLRWTAAGAVSAPTTVQMRLTRHYPDRLQAGAPQPDRCLSPEELRQNLHHFTQGLRGPRTRPCTGLVLSGLGLGERADLPAALDLARELGMDHIVVHASADDLLPSPGHVAPASDTRWHPRIDVLVLPCPPASRAEALRAALRQRAAPRLVCTVRLSPATVDELDALLPALIDGRPDELVWTLPFPSGTPPAPPDLTQVRAALSRAEPACAAAGIPTSIKGLPACLGPELQITRRRTGNRWYVDADHQGDKALLFLPEVVRFHKSDGCRFCREDADCDGYFAEYLDAAEVALRPLEAEPAPSR